MKSIPLTQGQVTLVDNVDYEQLSKHKWCVVKEGLSFYAARQSPRTNGKQHQIRMHRQILGLEHGDKRQGDHRNHNTLDNQRYNLRVSTVQQNQMNQKPRLNSFSQFKGVSWNKQNKKWVVHIRIKKKNTHLGCYVDEELAAMAYDLVTRKVFGEFAYLNFRGVE